MKKVYGRLQYDCTNEGIQLVFDKEPILFLEIHPVFQENEIKHLKSAVKPKSVKKCFEQDTEVRIIKSNNMCKFKHKAKDELFESELNILVGPNHFFWS